MRRLLFGVIFLMLASCGAAANTTGAHFTTSASLNGKSRALLACVSTDCGPYAVTVHWGGISIANQTGFYVYKDAQQVDDVPSAVYTFHGIDCGITFQIGVRAHDAVGATSNLSATNYHAPACGATPVNTGLPVISGSAQQGQTLSTTDGTWSVSGSATLCGSNGMTCAYQWRRCTSSCTNIGGATNSTYMLQPADVDDTIDVVVTATKSGRFASAIAVAVGPVTPSGGGGLPTGVTLQAIDGGTCDSSTGPCYDNYYCKANNGFGGANSYACQAGWDNPAFIPIVEDFAFYPQYSIATFHDLGMNTDRRMTGGADMTILRNGGVWSIQSGDPNETTVNTGSETVGTAQEEPGDWNTVTGEVAGAQTMFGLGNRFTSPVFQWSQMNAGWLTGSVCGASGQMTMPTVMTCTTGMPSGRHLDIPTADVYWFAGMDDPWFQTWPCQNLYNLGNQCTAAQSGQGSHYGDMLDVLRSWVTTYPAPVGNWIENQAARWSTNPHMMTPAEFSWSAWSTIVHGGRMEHYFDNGEQYQDTFGFNPSGSPISMYNQAKATDGLIQNLARIINAPFALNYASKSVNGYVFPTPHMVMENGMDIMTKYYTGGTFTNSSGTFNNGFYIFVNPRGTESQTNMSVTITLPSSDTTSGSVPYICACSPTQSTGTVTVSGHQFTDTFAKAADTHIYGPFAGT